MEASTWRNRIIGEGEEAPDQLLANPKNARRHPQAQQAALADVLAEVGVVQRVIVNKRTGYVVDGHARIALALRQGQPTIPVLYVDLDEREEALILATLDPISAMATYDSEALDALLRDVNTGSAALQEMLAGIADEVGLYGLGQDAATNVDAEPQISRAEELRAKWGTEPGQLWKLGEHRLAVGDCTDAAVVDRVMGGERVACVCTDPPYGIGKLMHGGTWATKADAEFQKMREWDDTTTQAFFDLASSFGPCVIWGGNYFLTPPSRCWLVWDKPEFPTMSSAELAWTNLDANTKRLECPRTHQADGAKDHATQKPVKVMSWSLEFLPEGLVLDPFSGSGTTLIACEQLGRRCRAIEIDPGYAAVTLQRWADATGGTPELIG